MIVIAMLAASLVGTASAIDPLPTLAVNPTGIHGVAGEEISVPVDLTSNGVDVHAYDVTASYNAHCLNLEGVASAQGGTLDTTESPGSVQIVFHDGASADPLADGTVFNLNVTPLCGRGSTEIGLTFTSFGNSEGESIDGAAESATLELNSRPDAQDDAAETDEDNSVVIFVEGNDSDADNGDGINVVDLTQPDAGSATIVDGDDNGNQVDDTIVFDPEDAFHWLAQGESATVSFQYTLRDVPPDNAAVTVTDEDTATVTVTILGVNDDPMAADDTANTDEDSVVTVYVLANDTDPDTSDSGHVVSAVTQPTYTDGAESYSAGSVIINGSGGSVTYDPRVAMDWLAYQQTQDITFDYTISDGKGGMDSASVTVTVVGVNDAPMAVDDVASQPGYLITSPDTPLTIDPLVNDSDPDVLDWPDMWLSNLGSSRAAVNGQTIDWTPAGWHGAETFAYTLNDPHQRSSTANITVVSGVRGDCNSDGKFDAGDLSACVLEILDADDSGSNWLVSGESTFPGSPLGCDANRDELVGAGDLSCKVKMLMEGVDVSCAAPPAARSAAPATLGLGAANADGAMALSFAAKGNGVAAAVISLAAGERFDSVAWSLPAGFESASFYAEGKLTLVVYSLSLAALPDGELASLRFNGTTDGVSIAAQASSLGGVDGSSVPFTVEDAPAGTDAPELNIHLFLPAVVR